MVTPPSLQSSDAVINIFIEGVGTILSVSPVNLNMFQNQESYLMNLFSCQEC